MKKPPLIAVLGGDRRQTVLSKVLVKHGYRVKAWAMPTTEENDTKEIEICSDWREAVQGAYAIVLPLPVSSDSITLNKIKDLESPLNLTDLFDFCKGCRLFGGKLNEKIVLSAKQKGITCYDYYLSEPLQLKNALLTAEACVSLLMQNLPVSIKGARFAILGFGRIGEYLTRILLALGADVTVYARREESLARAELLGAGTSHLRSLDKNTDFRIEFSGELNAILNTIPSEILTREDLLRVPQNCLLIELASSPGGFSVQDSTAIGLKSIVASALPGKYAPITAGKIIATEIIARLRELEDCERKEIT